MLSSYQASATLITNISNIIHSLGSILTVPGLFDSEMIDRVDIYLELIAIGMMINLIEYLLCPNDPNL
jgi:hypothetical protein